MPNALFSFIISLLIGLLLGIERERSHPEGVQAIGMRTFILFSLLGTMTATLNHTIITAVAGVFVFGIILLSYLRSTKQGKKKVDIGITTEVSAGIVFILGYMIPTFPFTAITLSGIILLILIERKRLHIFSREKLKPKEIEVFIILTIFALGVLSILPNRTIDPWQLFNPRIFGILITIIAGLQFISYITIRLFGNKFGRAISGFLGGFVSSTAVFATLRDTLGEGHFMWATMACAILSIVAMIIELIIILFVASPTLLIYIVWPLMTMIFISLSIVFFLLYFEKTKQKHPIIKLAPINFFSVLRSTVLITLILIFITFVKRYLGTTAIFYASFLTALFEFHSISLATTFLYLGKQLKIFEASAILALAMLATFISKIFLLWILTPRYFAFWLSLLLLVILSSGGIVYWWAIL